MPPPRTNECTRPLGIPQLLLFVCFGLAISLSPSFAQTTPRGVFPGMLSEFQQRALIVMDPRVVEDPDRTTSPCANPAALKVWSFGKLMGDMVGGDEAAASKLVKDWLSQFRSVQDINDERVEPRNIDSIWRPWAATNFDVKLAPFRLLAILSRADLLRSPLLAGENAGEIRFVFGAVDISNAAACSPLPFAVILEYGVRVADCDGLKEWADGWVKLAAYDPASPDYRSRLEAIAAGIIGAGSLPAKPYGSAIDRVRTNEVLAGSQYQLREFRLAPGKGLVQDTVAMTPREDLNGKPSLTAFLKSIEQEIAAQDYWIPRRFPSSGREPLLAGASTAGTQWTDGGIFAVNTCSGCHGAENGTKSVHIDPVTRELSSFLEQTEAPRREEALRKLAKHGCEAKLDMKVRRLVH